MSPHCTSSLPGNRYELLADGTARIHLTQGMTTVIDWCDLQRLLRIRWMVQKTARGRFYVVGWAGHGRTGRKGVSLHRFILDAPSGVVVDHRDGNELRNTRDNLRIASKSQNAANSLRSSANTSGFKGVSWNCKDQRWVAKIKASGHETFLGLFSDPRNAALAYDDAARTMFGEFAAVNFPLEGERAA